MADLPPTDAGAPSASPKHPEDRQARVLLAALHSARRRGDRVAAEQAWQAIVIAELDRVKTLVGYFQHDALDSGGRIPREDVDEVVAEVFVRLHRKIDTIQGRSVGELRNFMRTVARRACQDYARAYVRRAKHAKGSLDATLDDPTSATSQALEALAVAASFDDESAAEARALVHPALAEVREIYRPVLVMTEAGFTAHEIQEQLGISAATLYQRRRRGLLELREIIAEMMEDEA